MSQTEFNCFHLEKAIALIAEISGISQKQIEATVRLLDDGNTIPFIARYRKEITGGLDERQLRTIEDEYTRLKELAQRKTTILKTIEQQNLLTPELRKKLEQCFEKQALEDLYLPYKPKRKTRATKARERGLQPLADYLLEQQNTSQSKNKILRPFIDNAKEVPDAQSALEGACDIVAEHWAENAKHRQWLSEQIQQYGRIQSSVKRGKKEKENPKFDFFYEHHEWFDRIPSHRFLAMKRGEAEGILNVGIKLENEIVLRKLKQLLHLKRDFKFYSELEKTIEDCYQRLLFPSLESLSLQHLKEKADREAIEVFAQNLRELLFAAPAGPRITLGIDPGFRTGCKLAVVDGTGKFLENKTIYPTAPHHKKEQATEIVEQLLSRYNIELIAIGNGTASRETDQFISELLKTWSEKNKEKPAPQKIIVSEAGASVYSASEIAMQEYPELDLTVRGAISIAHRLQDPLAELVKIDPKSIGVGQYQHDVNQNQLRHGLEREVQSCVNSIGVNLNQASSSLLSYVAGIGPKLAQNIVEFRDTHGKFNNRKELLNVPKLGKKAFEQAAGFLRIRQGTDPLDNSAVHPESYSLVKKMATSLKIKTEQLIGNEAQIGLLSANNFANENCGLITINDILAELAKPGRDPRKEFKVAKFAEGINDIKDLKQGMILEGVVTNITKFGAFIDLGVHQDGLIHISELADRYIESPNEVVSLGDILRVKVLEVDPGRKRISVSKKQA